MPPIARILDANANRAREALRVMEEAARFILDDADLSRAVKELRHDFAQTLAEVPDLAAHRDTPGDVGTQITTAAEQSRASVVDVATAAGKRLSEALRAIEEYAKVLPGGGAVAGQAEALRYRGYEVERRLIAALGTGARQQWRLCMLLTESLCVNPWRDVLAAAIEGGVDCVQVREKDVEAGTLLARVREVVSICRPQGVAVIVNDRPDVALAAGADGVHLGQGDLPCTEVRKIVGRQLLVGISTSRLEDAQQALEDGADYCGVGPMFPTTTKHKPVIAGPGYLREYVAWGRLPHLAIGGITAENLNELKAAGGQGIAVSSALCAAKDPAVVARSLHIV